MNKNKVEMLSMVFLNISFYNQNKRNVSKEQLTIKLKSLSYRLMMHQYKVLKKCQLIVQLMENKSSITQPME